MSKKTAKAAGAKAAPKRGAGAPGGATGESLSLTEGSGPVAPPYQYKLSVVLSSTEGGIRLVYRDEAEWQGGKPRKSRTYDGLLTTAVWAKLRAELLAAGLLELPGGDGLGPPAGRVGVSTNELVLVQAGQAPVRTTYSLAALQRPEGKTLADVVARLKQLVAEIG